MIGVTKILLAVLLIINRLGTSFQQSIDTCNFTNQCIYNLEVSHCASTQRLRRSDSCSCTDVNNVEGDVDRLSSVIRQITDKFNLLSSQITASVSDLQTKKEHYQNLKNENAKLQSLYHSTSFNVNTTSIEIQKARQQWTNEIAKLKDAISKTSSAAYACEITLTASQVTTTTSEFLSVLG